MHHTTWIRQYVQNEGWWLHQVWQRGRLPWTTSCSYGPFTYDELLDAAEWIVFGYLELALAQLDDHICQDDQKQEQ